MKNKTKDLDKSYSVVEICKADIISAKTDKKLKKAVEALEPYEMEYIVGKFGEALMGNDWDWILVEIVRDYLENKKKK